VKTRTSFGCPWRRGSTSFGKWAPKRPGVRPSTKTGVHDTTISTDRCALSTWPGSHHPPYCEAEHRITSGGPPPVSINSRSINSRIANFRSYDVAARRAEIVRQTDLTEADIAVYDAADGLTIDQADRMVENVVG